MDKYLIPLSQPDISQRDIKLVTDCLRTSWISSKSPLVDRFEKKFADIVTKTKFAAAVNSGTSALFLALKALNIQKDDEVIIPAFTMVATINAVLWAGGRPVLVDCIKNDWNIDVNEIEKKITKKTKIILPVHIYGYPCNLEKILDLARKHNLFVVEDAAEAMGSLYKQRPVGGFGTLSCFSLYSNKLITTGNGGIICTNDKKLYQRIQKLRFFDYNEKSHFTHHLLGYNLTLTGLQASLGISQLDRFSSFLKKRRLIFSWYKTFLASVKVIKIINHDSSFAPNYWFPAVIFKSEKARNKAKNNLQKQGIETRIFFKPMHRQPVFLKYFAGENYPLADYFSAHGLLFPSYHSLTKKMVGKICSSLIKIL